MKKNVLAIAMVLLVGGVASAAYQTDFSTDVQADFAYAQIGRLGNSPDGNLLVDWTGATGGSLNVNAKYGRLYTEALAVTGDLNDGVYNGDVNVYVEFDVNSGAASTANIRTTLGTDGDGLGANTYPIYFVDANAGVISIIKKWGYNDSSEQETIAETTYSTTDMSQTFRLEFSAVANGSNPYGTIVDLSAKFYSGSTELASISGTDTPTDVRGSYTSGNVYWGVGQGGNSGTALDVNLVGYGVNVVPEPTTMGLLAFGGLAALRRRRKKA